MEDAHVQRQMWLLIGGLCIFIFLLNFKPSEPYLSEYLICNEDTQSDYCSSFSSALECGQNSPCMWDQSACTITPCIRVPYSDCGNDDYDYCEQESNQACSESSCYKHFSENQVNNDIYPWATYAYLPFLLCLGPLAELFSYRATILCGILGRVATRILLLYGVSLQSMQLMEVTYALGTAAEDIFSAYAYYAVSADKYQIATSYIKASSLLSCVLSGILGDVLVALGCSLRTLMWISAVTVWLGFLVGIAALRPPAFLSRDSLLRHSLVSDEKSPAEPLPTSDARSLLQTLRMQLRCLQLSLTRPNVASMLALWIVGNAIFSILYNYEVSIYEELAGSNTWNGCVLAIMLLLGSAGAMTPTWLDHNRSSEDADLLVANRLAVASFLASLVLVLFVSSWSLIPSVACLAIFFACWQYINALVYARLALTLQATQRQWAMRGRLSSAAYSPLTEERGGDRVDESEEAGGGRQDAAALAASGPASENMAHADPPYSFAVVAIVAANVIIQIVLQSILLSYLQWSLENTCWVLVFIFLGASAAFFFFSLGQFGIGGFGQQWMRAAWWVLRR